MFQATFGDILLMSHQIKTGIRKYFQIKIAVTQVDPDK
jgi:hypothetical protein